jgi:hypothetical protein
VGAKDSRKTFDNLSAFFPGVQVLAGDIRLACQSINAYMDVWKDNTFLPEEFDTGDWKPSKQNIKGTIASYVTVVIIRKWNPCRQLSISCFVLFFCFPRRLPSETRAYRKYISHACRHER